MIKIPSVAIVGRQNVGKSTLLNRLIGKRQAITEDLPGTTRDRIHIPMNHAGRDFVLIDTGGMAGGATDVMTNAVNDQVRVAMREAEVIIFLTEAKSGLTPQDEEIADEVRRSGKPVIMTVNKVDNDKLTHHAAE
ncbi:MAG: GTP-binding protein, partial [Dehalococcoidia bacterium]